MPVSISLRVSAGEVVFVGFLVEEAGGHCLCLPVSTNGGRGGQHSDITNVT